MSLTLVIGNKNYSSWSLRPWLALKITGEPFHEIRIPLYAPGSKEKILGHSPAGKVPILKDGALAIWDSLSICEYLAEKFPQSGLWPDVAATRAVARSVSCEMHSGFSALRSNMPMDIRARAKKTINAETETDIARILQIWRDCRTTYGKNGPFLFGKFTIADAMFAPVVMRFRSYEVPVDVTGQAYMRAILELPAVQNWCDAAVAEIEVLNY